MRWTLAALAACLAIAGGLGLAAADSGLQVDHVVVQGLPLREVTPPGPATSRPAVVVAHGFAGSARLMAGFGESLGRRGFVVVLLDFNGHGANPARPFDLQANLDTAVGYLRSRPGVDPARIALIGHSMGAGAVTRYAATHPEIVATVAISLPNSGELTAASPARLLLLVGALEFPGFHEAARQAVQTSPQRRLVTVPGVEHISILYAPKAHEEILAWLDAPDGPAPTPANRALAGIALLVAFGLAFPALAHLVLKGPGKVATIQWRSVPWAGAVIVPAAAVAAFVPMGWMPLAVTNYVVAFMALAGPGMVLVARWRKTPKPQSVTPTPTAGILFGYAAVAITVPLHLGVTHAIPIPARWWLLALTLAAFALFSYGVIRLCGGGLRSTAAAFAIAIVALTCAAIAGLAPGFLLLVLPLFAVLMAWQAGWTSVMTRLAAPAWLTAAVGAVLPALAAAVAMPLV